ncbi:hypothetical protein JCM5353_004381 [Sporobolomyces roseus]
MSDDELDPAFADFDLQHSPHSNDFDEAGSSLGFSLGEGFGQPLGNALGFELDSEGEPSGDEGGEVGHGSYQSEDEGSTPRKRTPKSNTPVNPAVRMSLAFELASASDGGNGRGRDLMKELGFEEDEEEQDDENDDVSSDGIALGGPLRLGEPLFDSNRNTSNESSLNKTHQVNGTTSRLRSRSSTTPLSSSTPSEQPSISPAEPDISPFDEDELETAFRATASSLEESISSTATFMTNLQNNLHGPSSSVPLQPSLNSNGIDSRLPPSSSLRLPVSIDSSSLPSQSPYDPARTPSYIDRQHLVEKSASTFVKTLYSTTKQREIQVRDITEIERVFARNEISWGAVLSELEPLPLDFDDPDEDSEASRPDSLSSSSPPTLSSDLAPSSPSSSPLPSFENVGPLTSERHSDLSLSQLISTEFHHLRTLTTALLNVFASMSDVAQVQSALGQEASRKLRSLRAQVVTVRDELVSLDRSEEFIVEFEEQRRSGSKKRDYAKEAKEIMNGVEEELEAASKEAGTLLGLRA